MVLFCLCGISLCSRVFWIILRYFHIWCVLYLGVVAGMLQNVA